MGKKTLEDILRIILVSVISIIFSVMATKRVILDSKLGKTEYEDDQEKRWGSHKDIHAKDDKRADETYSMVKFLYELELKNSKK